MELGRNRGLPQTRPAAGHGANRRSAGLPEGDTVFGIASTATLDALFRKAKARALIDDLHFHDTRHEAITRLAKRLDVLELARAVGHRDLRQLMTYYNETASALAKKLA